MCPLVESICVKNGTLQNVDYHNRRMNASRKKLFNSHDDWDLRQMIDIQEVDSHIVYKCRFVYDTQPRKVEFLPYCRKEIHSFQLVENNHIDYTFKSTDRSELEAMKLAVTHADDVLIVKNGYLTDCSSSNIVFYDGSKWITPSTPLLCGTRRQFYLEKGDIESLALKPSDLNNFSHARIINAMIALEESNDIPVKNILL
jgi:4-amino-4-deoxychorismate lyase